MIPVVEFRAENKEIRDLCTVLSTTISNYGMRNNSVIRELLERFTNRVATHLAHEDRSIYRDLLKKQNKKPLASI